MAILENGCHSIYRTNLGCPCIQISSPLGALPVCQISCFYHKMINTLKYFNYWTHYMSCTVLYYATSIKLVTFSSTAVCDSSRHFHRGDITFQPWGISLRINWSKTNQYKQCTLSAPLPRPLPGECGVPCVCLVPGYALISN